MGNEEGWSGRHAPDIVIADDDPAMCSTIVATLRQHGFVARGFASGHALIDHGGSMDARLLICEWQLPGMTGIDLFAALRGKGWGGKGLMLTRNGDEGLESIAIEAGFIALILKPFQEYTLINMTIQAIGRIA